MSDDKIGERLRLARKKLGLNQTQLAAIGGVTLNTQHRYEAGGLPSLEYLLRIGNAGADWYWILTGARIESAPLDDESTELLATFKGLPAFFKGVALAQIRALADGVTGQGQGDEDRTEIGPGRAKANPRRVSVHEGKAKYRAG